MRPTFQLFASAIFFFSWATVAPAASDQTAACNPIFGPVRFVGDVASDSKCTDDNIQSAIDATAANGSVCPAKIFITREHTYTTQHLTISNTGKSMALIGQGDGVLCGTTDLTICIGETCPPPPSGPLVTISGHDGDSVLHIDGANYITLRYLQISGGSVSDRGGGIYFDGTGSLTIDTSTIIFNHADSGGGIDFTGDGGNATLTLWTNALVLSNDVTSRGAGIRIAGNARMFALKAGALLSGNHADGDLTYGGALDIIGPARADLGAPGYGSLPLIKGNSAAYGGGIAVEDGGTIRLFSTDANHPISVSGNTASATGGGIFLGAGGTSNVACLSDFQINDNQAQEGTAIYGDQRALIGINAAPAHNGDPDPCAIPETQTALGAVACAQGVACNQFTLNTATDLGGNATDGALLLAQTNTMLVGNRFSATHNTGGYVVRSVADDFDSDAELYNCLLADNTLTHEVYAMTDGDPDFGAEGTISSCTIAGNAIGFLAKAIKAIHAFDLHYLLIDQPGVETLDFQGVVLRADYILTNDMQTLPARVENVLGTPAFVDAAHGNYRLLSTSPGVDFAPAQGGHDLDGFPRSVNLPAVDRFGPMDLGAYETHSPCTIGDTVFCNGFEP